MNLALSLAIAASLVIAQPTAQAIPIVYEGNITVNGPAVSGNIGGFSISDLDAANSDFWTFSGVAGQSINISASRLLTPPVNTELDPKFTLYFGTTTADQGTFDPYGSFGGMTYLSLADDEVDAPGPFGDPSLTLMLPFTGVFTIAIGGGKSDGVGPYPYSLIVQAVPEPSTLPLSVLALAGIGWAHRRKTGAARL